MRCQVQKKNALALASFIKTNKGFMTDSALAAEIGISQPYLSSILNGKRNPGLRLVNKIADYFGVRRSLLHRLVGWSDEIAADEETVKKVEALAQADPTLVEAVMLYSQIGNLRNKKIVLEIIKILASEGNHV
jgi:transcriptional regulator with XRE-family HTH domain